MLLTFKRLKRWRQVRLLCVALAICIITLLVLSNIQQQPNPKPKPHDSLCESQSTFQQRNTYIQKELVEYYANPHDPFVNHHQYRFIISSSVCAKKTMHVVFVVHSKPSHYHRRMLIRTTYGSVKQYQGKLLTVVFLLGAVRNESLQKELKKESETFGDIVQGNFIDSYKNLSIKHIMAMYWFTMNCKADFVMKLDDDTFVNPYRLLEYLTVLPKDKISIYCKVSSKEDTPDRDPESRTYTPYYQYPFENFPPFCLGFAYITTPDVWSMLYETSAKYKALYVDDVFVTGILASMRGVARKDIGEVMYKCRKHLKELDVASFRQSVVVLDRRNMCGDQPFRLWRNLTY